MKIPVDVPRPAPPPLPDLGYAFRDPALLIQALTHPSRAAEHPGEAHYERLEFLGDAVVDLLVAELLYQRQPGRSEGDLSRARHRLVAEDALAGIARELRLGPCLRLGRGASLDGSRDRDRVLGDALEAVVGAIYLDGGMDAVRALLSGRFEARIDRLSTLVDPKSQLQEIAQRRWQGKLPAYHPLEGAGPSHNRTFRCRVVLPDGQAAEGSGSSRQGAERQAAESLLALLAPPDPAPS